MGGKARGAPAKKKAKAVVRQPRQEAGEEPAPRPPSLRRRFTGKLVLKDGVKCLDRKFTDVEAWLQRRKKEAVPPGGWPKPPAHWPKGVRVDIGRPILWLPPGWGQGIKTTCASRLRCYISPEGTAYYHKHIVQEMAAGGLREGPREHQVDWARKRARISVAEGTTFDRKPPRFLADSKLFANLEKHERRHLPESARDLYFAVISARRADDERGLRNIVGVQAQLLAGGAEPVWYVDRPSLQSYKSLGLKAKVGGKLVPARNMALQDAARAGKPCVQISDDISSWAYYDGELGGQADLFAGNDAAKAAERLRVSPAAAARFLLAKLRGTPEAPGNKQRTPKLAGVFPLGNTGMAFANEAATWDHFILGDFFVADRSPVRFDRRLILKEDYDYTCAHLERHGSVLRCNRMIIAAVHETNAGGACSNRDEGGTKEREMIKILLDKWPGVFKINGKRGDTQVVMGWKRRTARLERE